jgi:hypothetical protein
MAAWDILRSREEFSNIFILCCDSHGLQLLIKDLLKNGRVADIFKKAQAIVNHFNNAPLQFAILRRIQREISIGEWSNC